MIDNTADAQNGDRDDDQDDDLASLVALADEFDLNTDDVPDDPESQHSSAKASDSDKNAGDATDEPPGEDAEPEPAFSNVNDWMFEYFRHFVERRMHSVSEQNGAKWCASWSKHPEAFARLYALWRAWEALRLDPTTGMSVWWRDHLDPHWNAITHPDGPFRKCKPGKHVAAEPLELEPVSDDALAMLPEADEGVEVSSEELT